ncbi:hemin ABC transporter permease [Pandoraea iniqua]|uniref:Hemin ABC transporter permease n=1 Tax=Pandoraea iniqua TaxID=2508288 RepID=A0A5E4RLE1_9BURK|nr:iron ABC transporter permease [Pandoraea iniqua]VVD64127.1 hemin ABC transporter permease [Pandoraea iniqua]
MSAAPPINTTNTPNTLNRLAQPATGIARRRPPRWLVMTVLVTLLALTVLAALCGGAYRIAPGEAIMALFRGASGDFAQDQARSVMLQIRLPRIVLGILVGAGFGAAGAALQALFRNPLADPGLIGVASGAALGAAGVIVMGGVLLPAALAASLGLWMLPLAAFVGALGVTALVYRLAAGRGRLALPLLLLAGIAINAISGAAIGLLTYLANDTQLRTLTFWTLGSLGGAQWSMLAVIVWPVALGIVVLASQCRSLNALLLGEAEALHLGVAVQSVKRRVMVACALCVGALVASSGMIGFIGLIAPHIVRLVVGPDPRAVLPAAALFGAILTLLADLVARTWVSPAELPLGILTALLGAPFFLMLLWRRRGQFGL